MQALVKRVRRGETVALEALYDLYAGQVYAFLLRAVSHEIAEELLQDVFLVLWQKANLYDPTRGSFNAWFFTLVRRRLYDKLRSERKHQADNLLSELEARPETNPHLLEDDFDLEQQVLQLFRDEEVHQALRSLPVEQRQVILMTYFGGLSQPELAAQLNVPVSTVKGRSRLGLQRLRQLLTE